MDARPFRPVRQVTSVGNENIVPDTKQTIHQRHKSAGSLLNMASNGNLKLAAAKRGALADSSNISKSLLPTSTTGAAVKKNSNVVVNTMVVAKAQENSDNQMKPKDTLSRPAQRPLSKAGPITHPTTMTQVKPLSGETQALRGPKQQWGVKRTSKSMVYNDAQSEKDQQAAGTLNAAAVRTSRASDPILNLEAEPSTRQPRHFQSQPALKHTQAPLRKQLTNPKNSTITKGDPDMVSTTETSELDTGLDMGLNHPHYGFDLLSEAPKKAHPGTYTYRTDDDATEAPYLDAVEDLPKDVEELLKEAHYPVPASIDEPVSSIATLPEPMPSRVPAKTEVKSVDFHPDLTSVAVDDHTELSDYDEDYYDDQGYTTAHSNRGDNTTGGTTIIFPPKFTKKDASELETAKQIVDSKRTPEEDAEEAWDVSMVAEYGDEIFDYMRQLEMTMLPNAHYMDIQTEIQWSMRSVLMDWVIQVHTRFGLLPETLFLTVNYIDRFLSYKIVSLGKLQLVGATAIFVAAKYEEINCPSVQEIVYMVDGGYSTDEILKAERFMLSMLNFELGWPGPMSFLRRISKADDYDLESRTLSKYFLEVTLMDERFVASPPSYIAAGAHCLSRLILEKGGWTPAHVHYSGYTLSQLKPLVSMMVDCCRIARKHHAAVFEKYTDRKYKRVSTFVEKQLLHKGFRLPFHSTLTQSLNYSYWDDETSHVHYPVHQGLKMLIPTEG